MLLCRVADAGDRRIAQLPIRPDVDLPAAERKDVSGRKLGNAVENGPRRQIAPEGEDLIQADEIDHAPHAGIGQNGFDFRGEEKGAVDRAVIQRPHPHAIPGREQLVFDRVPDRKSPFSVKIVYTLFALLLVKAKDDLGIGLGTEPMSPSQQLSPKLHVVEYFAVKRNAQRPILVVHRLPAGSRVDDAEARVRQARLLPHVYSAMVWTAITDLLDHEAKKRCIRLHAGRIHDSRYAAHAWLLNIAQRARARLPALRRRAGQLRPAAFLPETTPDRKIEPTTRLPVG